MNNGIFPAKTKTPLRLVLSGIPSFLSFLIIIYSLFTTATSEVGFTPLDTVLYIVAFLTSSLTVYLTFGVKSFHFVPKAVLISLTPLLSFFAAEFIRNNPFDIKLSIVLLNLFFYYLVMLTLTAIFGNTAPASVCTVVIPFLFSVVSYYVREFRGTPLFPWDLASYGTAGEVVSSYKIVFSSRVALLLSVLILLLFSGIKGRMRIRFKFDKFIRPAVAALSALAIAIGVGYLQTDKAISDYGLYPYLFTPDVVYSRNGFAVGFLMNLRYTSVDKPEGYSPESIDNNTDDYKSDTKEENDDKDYPNVIVIMNESLSDMTALCEYTTSEEIMPFISSLAGSNVVKGTAHSSVVGGNTPNSEFEFLTGMTMGFLPPGCIPYQQFIKSDRPSLATQMEDLGYESLALHPYWQYGWDRGYVYPYLGFDEMHFWDDSTFDGYEPLRGYTSDKGLYEYIVKRYEERDEETAPLFTFAVTMQNHSSYSNKYENFTPEITVDGLENNFDVTTYMSLVNESDSAFKWLTEQFADIDEKTVILMFGDHQPNDSIAKPLMKAAGIEYNDENIEESESRYLVPYVIWANYDLNDSSAEETSLNYLSTVLTSAAGIPQTGAQQFLSELMEEFPVINGRCFKDSEGVVHPVSEYVNYEKLMTYAGLQYNYLFDTEVLIERLWKIDSDIPPQN